MSEQEQLRDLVKKAFGPADDTLKRDLWPQMLDRLRSRPPATVPWFDWALAGALVIWLIVSPEVIVALMYQL